jgi:hypothetical protein
MVEVQESINFLICDLSIIVCGYVIKQQSARCLLIKNL